MEYKEKSNFNTLDMKTPVGQLPSKVLLLTEKRFADVPGGIVRDYRSLGKQNTHGIPKLSKTQQKEFHKYCNSEEANNYNDDSPTKRAINIAYQV